MTQNMIFQNILFKCELTYKGVPYNATKCYIIPGKSYIFHISYPIPVNNAIFSVIISILPAQRVVSNVQYL